MPQPGGEPTPIGNRTSRWGKLFLFSANSLVSIWFILKWLGPAPALTRPLSLDPWYTGITTLTIVITFVSVLPTSRDSFSSRLGRLKRAYGLLPAAAIFAGCLLLRRMYQQLLDEPTAQRLAPIVLTSMLIIVAQFTWILLLPFDTDWTATSPSIKTVDYLVRLLAAGVLAVLAFYEFSRMLPSLRIGPIGYECILINRSIRILAAAGLMLTSLRFWVASILLPSHRANAEEGSGN